MIKDQLFYPVLRSATIKFVHAFQSLYNCGFISCDVKGYQECLFDVDIGEEFEIKSKIGSKGRAFKLCDKRGQLGHLQYCTTLEKKDVDHWYPKLL